MMMNLIVWTTALLLLFEFNSASGQDAQVYSAEFLDFCDKPLCENSPASTKFDQIRSSVATIPVELSVTVNCTLMVPLANGDRNYNTKPPCPLLTVAECPFDCINDFNVSYVGWDSLPDYLDGERCQGVSNDPESFTYNVSMATIGDCTVDNFETPTSLFAALVTISVLLSTLSFYLVHKEEKRDLNLKPQSRLMKVYRFAKIVFGTFGFLSAFVPFLTFVRLTSNSSNSGATSTALYAATYIGAFAIEFIYRLMIGRPHSIDEEEVELKKTGKVWSSGKTFNIAKHITMSLLATMTNPYERGYTLLSEIVLIGIEFFQGMLTLSTAIQFTVITPKVSVFATFLLVSNVFGMLSSFWAVHLKLAVEKPKCTRYFLLVVCAIDSVIGGSYTFLFLSLMAPLGQEFQAAAIFSSATAACALLLGITGMLGGFSDKFAKFGGKFVCWVMGDPGIMLPLGNNMLVALQTFGFLVIRYVMSSMFNMIEFTFFREYPAFHNGGYTYHLGNPSILQSFVANDIFAYSAFFKLYDFAGYHSILGLVYLGSGFLVASVKVYCYSSQEVEEAEEEKLPLQSAEF